MKIYKIFFHIQSHGAERYFVDLFSCHSRDTIVEQEF